VLSSKPVTIEVKAQVPVVCSEAPKAEPLELRRVEPRAVKDEDGDYWVGLTPRHYENLSKNMADILGHIQERTVISAHYKHCIDRHNKKADEQPQAP
jgi:hypothetical protein